MKTLSAGQKEALLTELQAEKQAEKDRIEKERETYKELKDSTTRSMFQRLRGVSEDMLALKNDVFETFETVIKMKDELFKTKSGRQTDTFTTEDGDITVTIGNRVNEGWDDTVEVGVQKVREYLKTLAKDENSAALVETVMGLLSKDRKGNLKANRVLELRKLATKSGDPEFIDGLNIIQAAYRPAPSCRFIEVKYKDDNGKERALPLSMSAMD